VLSVLQIAQISSREKIVMKYSVLVIFKLALALLGSLLSIVAAGLFSIQTDDDRTGFRITRGVSFYLQILVIVLSIGLFVLALYDVLNSRKRGGDPTMAVEVPPTAATTYNNPGFRDGRSTNGEFETSTH
jgi:cytochrome c biogenesis factor